MLLINNTTITIIKGKDWVGELSLDTSDIIALSAAAINAKAKQSFAIVKSVSCVVTALPRFTFFFWLDVLIASLLEFLTRYFSEE